MAYKVLELGNQLWLSVAGVLLTAVVIYLYRYVYAPFQILKNYGIKGPRPLPFIGNLWERKQQGLLRFYEELYRKYGPVCGFYLGKDPCIMVADVEMLKEIMVKEFDSFTDKTYNRVNVMAAEIVKLPPMLIHAKGESWRRARKTLSPAFSAMKMKMMEPLVSKSCETLVDVLRDVAWSEKCVDVLKVFGAFSMETILAAAFGRSVNVQRGESDVLTEAATSVLATAQEDRMLSVTTIGAILDYLPILTPLVQWGLNTTPGMAGFRILCETAQRLVQARRESVQNQLYKDLLQLMIDARTDEDGSPEGGRRLTDKEIVSYSITFLIAGYETTSNTLAYTAYLLALHPTAQERLYVEIKNYFEQNPDTTLYDAIQAMPYLDCILNESLRMYPSVPQVTRRCLREVCINGVTIPKGSAVIIPIHTLHHNPDYWENPEMFDPDRFTAAEKARRPQLSHMPFGWGPRNCLGMRFALMEAKVALVQVLKKYKFIQAPNTEVPLKTVTGISMTTKHGVHLYIRPREQ